MRRKVGDRGSGATVALLPGAIRPRVAVALSASLFLGLVSVAAAARGDEPPSPPAVPPLPAAPAPAPASAPVSPWCHLGAHDGIEDAEAQTLRSPRMQRDRARGRRARGSLDNTTFGANGTQTTEEVLPSPIYYVPVSLELRVTF